MDQNLGKTFGRWGVGPGPYVVLPLLGPSSLRGMVGKAGDYFIDPVGYYLTTDEDIGVTIVDALNTRDQLNGVIN